MKQNQIMKLIYNLQLKKKIFSYLIQNEMDYFNKSNSIETRLWFGFKFEDLYWLLWSSVWLIIQRFLVLSH